MDHFELIDMETWPRREIYKLYTEQWTAVTYSFTKKLSLKTVIPYLKAKGIKLVPALMWLVTREVNKIENYRLAIREKQLGRWDVIHPVFPTLNSTENITFHSLVYGEEFLPFYEAYLREQQEYKDSIRLWANGAPENFFIVSIFPWLNFDSLSLQLKNPKWYYAPYVAMGQYDENLDIPAMIMSNHAAIDGWHVAKFYDGMQYALDHPEQWCP